MAPSSSKTSERTVPMEILNLSMPRTGSLSIKHALSILDIDCYHGTNLGGNNPDRWFFLEAARAKVKGQKVERTAEYWDQVLGKFGGVSDFPCIAFTDELIEAYPDAKVILVERDVNSWTGSFIEILEDWRSDWKFQLLTRLDPWIFGPLYELLMLSLQIQFKGTSNEHLEKTAAQGYKDQYAHVKKVVPPNQLLVYTLGSGWEPLCELLGKPVPNVPFPRLNDRQTFIKTTKEGWKKYIGISTVAGTMAVLTPILLSWWKYRIV
ncbi:hypothetical protein N7513_009441 [Penicillium frequentans]|nr:hypothetical protein N7513_009441 [Penicillium glabrum]